jgi:DNA-binding response OmpR family regulator
MAKILLIDDDESLRSVIRATLEHFGHTVIEASDGKQGLELFAVSETDLVITDIVMPEKEGLEVLMELRKRPKRVKVIAISGGGSTGKVEYLHLAKLMGASSVLAKPFSVTALMAVVDDLLAGGSAVGSPPSVT